MAKRKPKNKDGNNALATLLGGLTGQPQAPVKDKPKHAPKGAKVDGPSKKDGDRKKRNKGRH